MRHFPCSNHLTGGQSATPTDDHQPVWLRWPGDSTRLGRSWGKASTAATRRWARATMRFVTNDRLRPDLDTWAEFDPGRFPFDPGEVPAVVRTVGPPPPRPVWHAGERTSDTEAWAWVEAVGVALSKRYGPWAHYWHWTPGERERLGWITDRIPAPADAPAFVTDLLVLWRRWLEELAERFDRFLPLFGPAQPGDVVVVWESAFADVMTPVIARVVDDDGWQGRCRRVLQWFLTAAGVPVAQAKALVENAIDARFDHWIPPTPTVIDRIATRVARGMLDLTGAAPPTRADWPDTWPQGWPSPRSTNTGGEP